MFTFILNLIFMVITYNRVPGNYTCIVLHLIFSLQPSLLVKKDTSRYNVQREGTQYISPLLTFVVVWFYSSKTVGGLRLMKVLKNRI
jgi:hypothetical protein